MALQFVLIFLLPVLSWSHVEPECHMTTPQLIEYNHFPAETHFVPTEDGYILQIHRIPHPSPKGVVFLQHGLLDTSATWVLNTRNNSLAFVLADYGYDVWMGNVRGNRYSMNHTTLKPSDRAFWDFSFDEMAAYDLPAMLHYVIDHTNSSISYVGHSQGTLIAFIEYGRNRELTRNIDLYVALAPVARISHIEGLFKLLSHFVKEVSGMAAKVGIYEFLPQMMQTMISELAIILCPVQQGLCAEVFQLLAGETPNMNKTRIPVYGSHCPSGTSVKNMLHWDQIYKARTLQMWDYGSEKENTKHYNTSSPPVYDVTGLNIPTMFISGGSDYLGDPRDVAWLDSQLKPGILIENIFYDDYNHLDFLWALNARERVFMKIVKELSKLHG